MTTEHKPHSRVDLERVRLIAADDPDIWPDEAEGINLARDLLDLLEQLEALREGLLAIERGDWNFGNAEPGLTVMQYAGRVARSESTPATSSAPSSLSASSSAGVDQASRGQGAEESSPAKRST